MGPGAWSMGIHYTCIAPLSMLPAIRHTLFQYRQFPRLNVAARLQPV
jgi:hypothetical protein